MAFRSLSTPDPHPTASSLLKIFADLLLQKVRVLLHGTCMKRALIEHVPLFPLKTFSSCFEWMKHSLVNCWQTRPFTVTQKLDYHVSRMSHSNAPTPALRVFRIRVDLHSSRRKSID